MPSVVHLQHAESQLIFKSVELSCSPLSYVICAHACHCGRVSIGNSRDCPSWHKQI